MTDEEILKRLAEIEGYRVKGVLDSKWDSGSLLCFGTDEDGDEYSIAFNPLFSDAQCLALVKKYRVAVAFYEGHGRLPAQWCAICRSEIQHTIEEIEATNASPSLNRAVALAIIEAHK